MTAGTDLRLLRAAVFTAVCVLLSAAGHSMAAGSPVPLWTLGAGCALVFAATAPLAGRERSLPGITAALAAGQTALHVLFTAGHDPASATTATTPTSPTVADRGGMVALARQLLCNDGGHALTEPQARRIVADAGLPTGPAATGTHATGTAHHAAGGGTGGPGGWESSTDAVRTTLDAALAQLSLPMLLGHLLAAAALGWLLHRGETAVWRLVRISATTARTTGELMTVRALRAAVRLLRTLRHGLTGTDGPDVNRRAAPVRTPRVHATPLAGAATRRGPPSARDELHLAA